MNKSCWFSLVLIWVGITTFVFAQEMREQIGAWAQHENSQGYPIESEWLDRDRIYVDPDSYSAQGASPPNYFLCDVTQQIFARDCSRTSFGHPVRFRTLYNTPEKYGWKELPDEAPKAGAIVVWDNIGGVVVSESSSSETSYSGIKVLYPSHKRNHLHVGDASFIDDVEPKVRPKYLVPADIEIIIPGDSASHWSPPKLENTINSEPHTLREQAEHYLRVLEGDFSSWSRARQESYLDAVLLTFESSSEGDIGRHVTNLYENLQGFIQFRGCPESKAILIDGEEQARKTNATVNLSPADYHVRVEHENCVPKNIEVIPTRTEKYDCEQECHPE